VLSTAWAEVREERTMLGRKEGRKLEDFDEEGVEGEASWGCPVSSTGGVAVKRAGGRM
jgi:hypothetical protein